MINGLKISAALLGVVAMFASVELSTCSVLSTASAQVCGCGNASCGGCLAGLRSRRAGAEVAYSADDPIVSTVYGEPVEVAGPVVGGCQSCRTCQKCQTCKPAPTAPCQYCTLESKKVKVDKTRFQVEQKEVCVPAVRLPWMKCNPPKRSRVRTVNVLKKEKYKGETCEYKWSVHEPEDFDNSPEPTPASGGSGSKSSDDSVLENTSGGSGSRAFETYPDPSSETSGLLELSDPAEALGDIPRPPLEN